MHLLTKIENRDGIYHVRLYSVPARSIQTDLSNGFKRGMMPRHYRYLIDEGNKIPTEFAESLVQELGSRRLSIDGQFLMGKPDYSTWKLTLKSDPFFFDLVNECRKLDRELWCEVVLEQPVTDCPPLKPHEVYYPRKKRVFFWGKLLRHDTKGKALVQSLQSEGNDSLVRVANTKHKGNLELTFTHWLKVNTSEEASFFLDVFRAGYILPDQNFSWGVFFYKLLEWITPTPLFAIADERLITKDEFGDGWKSISRGNLRLRRQFNGDTLSTQELYELESEIRKNGAYRALFEFDNTKRTAGQYSLFQWKDLGQGLYEVTREFFKRFQVELPCMEDTHLYGYFQDNPQARRELLPQAVTRWLFTEPRMPKKRLHFTSRSGTVEYQPAAMWAKKIKITEPAPSESEAPRYQPRPDYIERINPYEGGQEIAYRTLTKFMGQSESFNWNTNQWEWLDDPRGYELYVRNAGALPVEVEPVRNVSYLHTELGVSKGESENWWASVHARILQATWGNVASTLKFDFKGIGVEPFGKSNSKAPKIKGTFGKYDLGEFPLHRSFDSAVGLLFGPDPATNLVTSSEYLLYEVEQQPGGDSKASAIELHDVSPIGVADRVLPGNSTTPPPPPPYNPPPTISINSPLVGATVAGSIGISSTASDDVLVKRVKVYIDGVFKAYAVNTFGSVWDYTWNTTTVADGGHLIQVRAEDEEGNYGYDDCNVTVDN